MAYGLKPAYHAKGGCVRVNNIARSYTIASAYSTAIYKGDPVALTTGGTLIIDNPGTTVPIGVFDGVTYKASDGEYKYLPYWPASTVGTEIKAYVFDDPEIVFMVEADQVGTAFTSAYLGTSGDLTIGTPDTVTNISGAFVDTSGTWGATAAEVKVLGSAEGDETFTALGTAMDLFVKFNEHFWNQGGAGVAAA